MNYKIELNDNEMFLMLEAIKDKKLRLMNQLLTADTDSYLFLDSVRKTYNRYEKLQDNIEEQAKKCRTEYCKKLFENHVDNP